MNTINNILLAVAIGQVVIAFLIILYCIYDATFNKPKPKTIKYGTNIKPKGDK